MMNKYQSDVVADALNDLQRAAAKLAMVAAHLCTEAAETDGAARAAKANTGLAIFELGGHVLLAIDRYKSPIKPLEKVLKNG